MTALVERWRVFKAELNQVVDNVVNDVSSLRFFPGKIILNILCIK